ncbi:Outer membrane protein beta-barrel domain-containing protein [Tenacibaculum sp. MAR_2009_124]|uniref:outer membrane beta-barrel protein n=1 Tax=Tenacibaculum sp. MAR_2009_124 TaxID=1250059 RepID=UPI000898ABDB|nr:outer membrane beta-barrel protein [Tenacibaculum sp. MAR_2009_124]SEC86014.1 Outer membrane protein beta-barrel domain-containing protein [Tenacibaculum sp. MAR_2009_124]
MKRLLLIAIPLFLSTNSYCQIGRQVTTIYRGDFYISGGLALTSENRNINNVDRSPESKTFGYSISPKFGYFFNDNLAIGAGGSITHNDNENFNGSNFTYNKQYNSYSVFAFLKKFFNIDKKLLFSLQGELRYSHIKKNIESIQTFPNEYLITNNISDIYELGVRPGITFFLTKKIAFEASFGFLTYNIATTISDNPYQQVTSNNFDLDFNSENLVFGLAIFL